MKEATRRDDAERMTRVLIHIQENLDRELSLDDLAGVAGFSPFHFHRIFRGMLGESVKEHVRRLRLERAALRLVHTDRRVIDVALEAGYESHEAFTRAFKAMAGESPRRFRARRRAAPISAAPSNVHYSPGRPLHAAEVLWATRGGSSMRVRIQNFEAMRVTFIRHTGPYLQCAGAWDRLLPRLGSQGRLGAGTVFLGLCHDDPDVTPPEHLRYDACVTVDGDFIPEADIGVQTVAGGDYATATHIGPYERIGETYARLFGEWMPSSGREPRSAPCVEVYLSDPESTEPEDLVTEIRVPLEERRRR